MKRLLALGLIVTLGSASAVFAGEPLLASATRLAGETTSTPAASSTGRSSRDQGVWCHQLRENRRRWRAVGFRATGRWRDFGYRDEKTNQDADLRRCGCGVHEHRLRNRPQRSRRNTVHAWPTPRRRRLQEISNSEFRIRNSEMGTVLGPSLFCPPTRSRASARQARATIGL